MHFTQMRPATERILHSWPSFIDAPYRLAPTIWHRFNSGVASAVMAPHCCATLKPISPSHPPYPGPSDKSVLRKAVGEKETLMGNAKRLVAAAAVAILLLVSTVCAQGQDPASSIRSNSTVTAAATGD